jgi:tetratricopeptide (TPR) repeat protein
MAAMTAQMLRAQVTGSGATPDTLLKQAQALMSDPRLAGLMDSLAELPAGSKLDDREPPPEWTSLTQRGFAALSAENASEAEDCFLQALQLVDSGPGTGKDQSDNLYLYETLQHLTSLYLNEERFDEAEPFLKMWVTRGEKLFGSEHSILTGAYYGLGAVREHQKKTNDAELLYNHALYIADKALAADPGGLSGIRENIGAFYNRLKSYSRSDLLFESALILRERAGENGLELAEQLLRYGLVLLERGEKYAGKGKPYVERALKLKESILPAGNADLLRSRTVLGAIECQLGNHEAAEKILVTALADLEAVITDHEDLIYPLEQLKKLYQAKGDTNASERVASRISEIESTATE